jgi:hypothetical protein
MCRSSRERTQPGTNLNWINPEPTKKSFCFFFQKEALPYFKTSRTPKATTPSAATLAA